MASKEGFGVYDMLAPGDSYKHDRADDSAAVCDWVKPLTLTGFLYARLYLGLLRSAFKAALKLLPQSARRFVARGYGMAS
jgi:CelD/BcsL family acetyltransferase involved in cellulose biosynthesis